MAVQGERAFLSFPTHWMSATGLSILYCRGKALARSAAGGLGRGKRALPHARSHWRLRWMWRRFQAKRRLIELLLVDASRPPEAYVTAPKIDFVP